MRGFASLFLLSIAFPSAGISAQNEQPFEIGEILRITAPASGIEEQKVRYLRLYRDTLTVQADTELALPVASVTRLDVSRGIDHRATLIGLATGAVAGVVIGIVVASDDDSEFTGGTPSEPSGPPIMNSGANESSTTISGAVVGPIAGAFIGGFLGGVVGKTFRKHRWEEVPLDRLRIGLALQADRRFALAISVSF